MSPCTRLPRALVLPPALCLLLCLSLPAGCGRTKRIKKAKKEEEPASVDYQRFDGATEKDAAKPMLRLCDRVFRHFQAKRTGELYGLLTRQAKEQLTPGQFDLQNHVMLEFFGESRGTNVLELHWMKVPDPLPTTEGGERGAILVESEYLPDPVWVMPSLSGEVAVALCEAMTDKEDSRFWVTLFLAKEGEKEWRLHTFQIKPRILEGHNGFWFTEQAKALKAAGKVRSAFLYDFLGASLLTPGKNIFAKTAFDRTLMFFQTKGLKSLPFPRSREPETWKDPATGKAYMVVSVIPSLLQVEICLEVHYGSQLADLEGEAARAERQGLCDLTLALYPEYAETFSSILVRSINVKKEIGSTVFDIDEPGAGEGEEKEEGEKEGEEGE